MFLYKNLFFSIFFQSQSCLLESTAAIFRQSAGYVDIFLPGVEPYALTIILQSRPATILQYL